MKSKNPKRKGKALPGVGSSGVVSWRPIASAPTKGREQIWLKVPGQEPQLAYSDTWWTAGFSVECKPTHWKPVTHRMRDRRELKSDTYG